ncbi:MAG: hypothetical protein ACREXY_24565, partial [Gammaproteobacteria bacterium]
MIPPILNREHCRAEQAGNPTERGATAPLERGLDGALRDIEAIRSTLAVRTLPNDESKKYRAYGDSCRPPFFSLEAIHTLIERGIGHVLVDIPSLDK